MIDLTAIERRARGLRIRFMEAGTGPSVGQRRSIVRGNGLAFAECRDYRFGDDVRHIDWNATARLGQPLVKVFEADRRGALLLMVDVSGSQRFGGPTSKLELAREIATLLAFVGAREGDDVGAILFSDRVERVDVPRAGRARGWAIARAIANHRPQFTGTSLARACADARKLLRRPGWIVILSDFLDRGYERELRALTRRHTVVAIVLIDPRETALPDVGLIRAQDMESGAARWIDTSSRRARRDYAERFRGLQRSRRRAFASLGVPFVEIALGRSYRRPIAELCEARARRTS